jgi:undecaprenyl diphosphate synthase
VDIDEELFATRLSTSGIPEPDLVIRTSGEQRISNFLLWQTAHSEIVFLDTLWPDFSKEDLTKAVLEFQERRRDLEVALQSG